MSGRRLNERPVISALIHLASPKNDGLLLVELFLRQNPGGFQRRQTLQLRDHVVLRPQRRRGRRARPPDFVHGLARLVGERNDGPLPDVGDHTATGTVLDDDLSEDNSGLSRNRVDLVQRDRRLLEAIDYALIQEDDPLIRERDEPRVAVHQSGREGKNLFSVGKHAGEMVQLLLGEELVVSDLAGDFVVFLLQFCLRSRLEIEHRAKTQSMNSTNERQECMHAIGTGFNPQRIHEMESDRCACPVIG